MAPGETDERAGTTPADDPLKRLGERLEQASDAAERLMDEAARFADHLKPPPSGWQTQEQADEPAHLPTADLALALQYLGELVPDDLQRRLAEAVRELLLAIRALIDWNVERLERRRAGPIEVQDIPVL